MTWRHAFALALSAVIVVGCTGGGFSEKVQQGKGNVFRYPLVTSPTTMDPGAVQDGDTIDCLQQIYEGLVGWGEDNKPQPRLAERIDIEDGGKTYIFTLRDNIKFHNGRAITAEDFKWSMTRNLQKGVNSPVAQQYLSDIVGVNAVAEGKAQEISGVEVRDPKTLVIRLDKPRPYFLGKLTYLVAAALPKEVVPFDKPMTETSQMIGAGPFKLARYVPDQIVVLEPNADYWDGKPEIDQIERPIILDASTRLNKYKGGELDLVQLERQDIAGLQQDPELSKHLKFFDRPAIWYVAMNQIAFPVFRDVRVRRAFAMAIDKEPIVKDLLGGVNTIANSIIPPGVPGHRSDAKAIQFNVEEAKKLLADAGFPGGKGFPPVELNFREARPDIRIVAEAVAGQLKQNLGVEVSLKTSEWGAYLEKWNQKTVIPFYHMRWAADYLDPENFLSFMLATYGPENKLGYSNPEFDQLCRTADMTMDWDKRQELYSKAEDIVLQDAPWIPIYFQRDAELIRPRVAGLRESLFGHLPHSRVRIASATGP
ncbi:MAG: Oligopeptide-binding protein OppA [Fimbriimonadaceae bacterium]|nr:Oligopeptide-binding protein OppA [Fimbriimonadaceae bacterium]